MSQGLFLLLYFGALFVAAPILIIFMGVVGNGIGSIIEEMRGGKR